MTRFARVLEIIEREHHDRGFLPAFIDKIVSFPHSYTLLVKGQAGTGKTTLAMDTCLAYKDSASVLYVSTRTNFVDLAKQYTRFTSEIGEGKTLGMDGLSAGKKDVNVPMKLITIGSDEPVPLFNLERHVKQLHGLGKPIIVFVDPADKLIDDVIKRTPNKDRCDAFDFFIALARAYDLKLFLISETGEHVKEDYLVDGIVTLHYDQESGFRRMHVHKMRNLAIDQQAMLYTLHAGRFRVVNPVNPRVALLPVPDKIKIFYDIMHGGDAEFFKGLLDARVLCVDFDVHANNIMLITHLIFIVVALLSKMNVFYLLPPDIEPGELFNGLEAVFGNATLERHFRVGFLPAKSVPPSRDAMVLHSSTDDINEEFRDARHAITNLHEQGGSTGTLIILPLDHVYVQYRGPALERLYKTLHDNYLNTGTTCLFATNLSFKHGEIDHMRFVESFSSRITHAIKALQVEKTLVFTWTNAAWPAFSVSLDNLDMGSPGAAQFRIVKIS